MLPSIPFRDDKMEKLESPFPCKRALSGGLPTARHCLTDERMEREERWKLEVNMGGSEKGEEMVRWKIEDKRNGHNLGQFKVLLKFNVFFQ